MRAFLQGVAAATVAVAAPLVATTSAGAQPDASMRSQQPVNSAAADDCPADHFCLYDGPNWNSPLLSVHESQGRYLLPLWAVDRASSYKNYTHQCLEIRDYANFFNHYTHITASSHQGRLSSYGHPDGTWNNRINELHTTDCT